MNHVLRGVTLVVILGMATPAWAQKANGGVRAGLNLAKLTLTPELPAQVDDEQLPGLVVGVYGSIPISGRLSVQPEVLYSQQGLKLSGDGMTVRMKFDYVQFPALLKIRATAGSPVSFLAGPAFGLRTRARFEFPGALGDSSEEFEDDISRFDVGIVAGAAADVGRWLVIDGRYTWGLLNLAKDGTGEGSAYNRVISLSAGLRF